MSQEDAVFKEISKRLEQNKSESDMRAKMAQWADDHVQLLADQYVAAVNICKKQQLFTNKCVTVLASLRTLLADDENLTKQLNDLFEYYEKIIKTNPQL
jgi:hypothetical protein